jgi:hypothetical protein
MNDSLITNFQESEEALIPKHRLSSEFLHVVFKDLDTFIHYSCLISPQSVSEYLFVQLWSVSLELISYMSGQ